MSLSGDNEMTLKQGTAYDINTALEHITLSTEDMIATFKVSKATLWRWIKQKKLPPPFDCRGRAAQWTIGQIRDWQSARALAVTQSLKEQMINECTSDRGKRRQTSGEFDLP